MSHLSGDLKVAVAGFMARDPSVFVRGQLDLLLLAANNARLYAERLVDFEWSKGEVDFPGVTLVDGVDLSVAVLHGTSIPVKVKKVVVPYLPLADNNQYPVDFWTKRTWSDRLKKRFESARPTDTSDYAGLQEIPFVVVQNGTMLSVRPADSKAFPSLTFTIYADAFLWLPDYVDGTENDFLLDNCFDWMLFYCISQLNFYLKEDERVQISAEMLKDTWNSVVRWNNELLGANVDDVNLD